jgi:predicted RNA binding protein YcfA (HicA-like mRNA interferase family)
MKSMKHKDLMKLLKKYNVEFVRQGKGSHEIYRIGTKTASIPSHKIMSPGTLRDIFKLLDINYKELNL